MTKEKQFITVGIYGANAVLFKDQLPPEPSVIYEFRPEVCDVAIVFDDVSEPTRIRCREGFVWKITMEPYVKGQTPYAIKHPKVYSRIFAQSNVSRDKRVEISPPRLPWLVSGSYEELQEDNQPASKREVVSMIASKKTSYPGHKPRTELANHIENHDYGISVFGRGRNNEIVDKRDALDMFMYSFAIENSKIDNYWTEKISDCFLTYTVPIYYGAPNIGSYFPEGSFIFLEDLSVESVLNVLKQLSFEDYAKRLPALEEARKLYLEKYYLQSFINQEITQLKNIINLAPMKIYQIKPVKTYRDWYVTHKIRFVFKMIKNTTNNILNH